MAIKYPWPVECPKCHHLQLYKPYSTQIRKRKRCEKCGCCFSCIKSRMMKLEQFRPVYSKDKTFNREQLVMKFLNKYPKNWYIQDELAKRLKIEPKKRWVLYRILCNLVRKGFITKSKSCPCLYQARSMKTMVNEQLKNLKKDARVAAHKFQYKIQASLSNYQKLEQTCEKLKINKKLWQLNHWKGFIFSIPKMIFHLRWTGKHVLFILHKNVRVILPLNRIRSSIDLIDDQLDQAAQIAILLGFQLRGDWIECNPPEFAFMDFQLPAIKKRLKIRDKNGKLLYCVDSSPMVFSEIEAIDLVSCRNLVEKQSCS